MWRLAKHLSGQCVYTNQDVTFIGEKAATISEIYIGGKKVRCILGGGFVLSFMVVRCLRLA